MLISVASYRRKEIGAVSLQPTIEPLHIVLRTSLRVMLREHAPQPGDAKAFVLLFRVHGWILGEYSNNRIAPFVGAAPSPVSLHPRCINWTTRLPDDYVTAQHHVPRQLVPILEQTGSQFLNRGSAKCQASSSRRGDAINQQHCCCMRLGCTARETLLAWRRTGD